MLLAFGIVVQYYNHANTEKLLASIHDLDHVLTFAEQKGPDYAADVLRYLDTYSYTKDDLRLKWGDPTESLSDSNEDIWLLSDEYQLVIKYDSDEDVERITVQCSLTKPENPALYNDGISLDGTVFTCNGHTYDFAELEDLALASLVYNLHEYRRVGEHILVLGSMGKNAEYYAVFNPATQTFERGIAAARFIYQEEDIQTAVYSFETSVYRYDGTLIKTLDLSESEYIYDISFDETGRKILVDIAINASDDPPRQEIISLS